MSHLIRFFYVFIMYSYIHLSDPIGYYKCMGQQEIKSKKKQKRANIQKIILHTIAGAGFISVALVAPNVIGAMGKLGLIPNSRQKKLFRLHESV